MKYYFNDCASTPVLINYSKNLLSKLKTMDLKTLQTTLKVNDKIIDINYKRYQNFNLKSNSLAIYTYTGLQYKYFNISQFNLEQLNYINNNIKILSAFYGILKPFDGIDYYRLDFNNNLKLYNFWNHLLYDQLIINNNVIINLASKEYEKLITKYIKNNTLLINIHFKEFVNSKLISKATNSKMARGLMLAYIVKNQISDYNDIKNFKELNYKFSTELSNKNNYVFIK